MPRFGSKNDNSLEAKVRPGSLEVTGQQVELFPFDAFNFEYNESESKYIISLKDPWQFYFSDPEGYLGGWEIDSTSIKAVADLDGDGTNDDNLLVLNSEKRRLEVWDNSQPDQNLTLAIGYLDGIEDYTDNDYGFYIKDPNTVSISGGGEYSDGDFDINSDAAYVIKNSDDEVVGRFGSIGFGEIGLILGPEGDEFFTADESGLTLTGSITATSGELQSLLITGILTIETGGEISAGTVTVDDSGISGEGFTLDDEGLSISGGTININGGVFEVDSDGNLTATAADITGKISADEGDIGGWTIETEKLSTTNIDINSGNEEIIIGTDLTLSASDGISAVAGDIGGWIITPDLLKSSDGLERIELHKAKNRVSIFANDEEKVVQGFLDGLDKNDGSGTWGAGDYGFWAKPGNKLRIDGDSEYINGDWLIHHDASYLIENADGEAVIRLGTGTKPISGNIGLFLNEDNIQDPDEDDPTGYRSYLTPDKFFVGNDSKYLDVDSDGNATFSGTLTVGTMPVLSDDGLVAHWSFDDGEGIDPSVQEAYWNFDENVEDQTDNGNDGTFHGGTPTYVDGVAGKALSFDGVDDYVNFGPASDIIPDSSFSISSWYLADDDAVLFSNMNDTTQSAGEYFLTTRGFNHYSGDNEGTFISWDTVLNTWTHLVVTVADGGDITIYQDKEVIATDTAQDIIAALNDLLMAYKGYGTDYGKVIIDDARIFSRALTAAEVKYIYNNPGKLLTDNWADEVTDNSGKGHTGENNGASFVPGISGRALAFDGVDDYVATDLTLDLSKAVTISVWANPDTLDMEEWQRVIISNRDTVPNSIDVFIDDDGYYSVIAWNKNGSGDYSLGSTSISPAIVGTLTKITVVHDYSNSTAQLYIDGSLIEEKSISGTFEASSAVVRIGLGINSKRYFPGLIDEPRIYNRALTADEIKYLYWNPQGNGKAFNGEAAELEGRLGDLSFKDVVEQAQLGTTIIEGGHITTELLTDDDYDEANPSGALSIDMDNSVIKTDGFDSNDGWKINGNGVIEIRETLPDFVRTLKLGSTEGVKSFDSNDKVLHDIAKHEITNKFRYLGHYYTVAEYGTTLKSFSDGYHNIDLTDFESTFGIDFSEVYACEVLIRTNPWWEDLGNGEYELEVGIATKFDYDDGSTTVDTADKFLERQRVNDDIFTMNYIDASLKCPIHIYDGKPYITFHAYGNFNGDCYLKGVYV